MKLKFKIIVALVLLLILPLTVSATDWYVRPAGGNYGTKGGTSYNNAWDGLLNVKWGSGGVQAGDSLYVCGLHIHNMTDWGYIATQAQINVITGTGESSRVTIRGDCPNDPGIVWGAYRMNYEPWVDEGNNVWSIALHGDSFQDWYFQDITKDSWVILEPETSIVAVENHPGSFYSSSYGRDSKLYVHLTDNGNPTGRIYANWYGYNFNIREGKSYITFLKLKMYHISGGIWNPGDATHIRWENCTYWYGDTNMFAFFNGCDYMEIINCDIAWAGNGIYTISGSNTGSASYYVFKGNYIHDIGVRPSLQNGDAHCIGIQGGVNGTIEDNICENCGSGPLLYAFTNQELKNTLVKGNIVKNCHTLGQATAYGISTQCNNDARADKSGNRFYYNIVSNCSVCGRFQFEQEQEVFNNVFSNCQEGLVSGRNYNGIGAKVKARNNIFINNKNYHIGWFSGATVDYKIDSDYNIFYPATGLMFKHAVAGGDMTFIQWQQHTVPGMTFDPHSIATDPLFVNPVLLDFHLSAASPGIDAGINVGLTHDKDGKPVPTGAGVDIGVYEYQGSVSCAQADINCDNKIDVSDLILVSRDFGKTSNLNNEKSDTDKNNIVDIFDVVFVASRFT